MNLLTEKSISDINIGYKISDILYSIITEKSISDINIGYKISDIQIQTYPLLDILYFT